jgi:hypothetical protein
MAAAWALADAAAWALAAARACAASNAATRASAPWAMAAASVSGAAGGLVGDADRDAAVRMAWAGRTVAAWASAVMARWCRAASSSLEEDLLSASASALYPSRVDSTCACLAQGTEQGTGQEEEGGTAQWQPTHSHRSNRGGVQPTHGNAHSHDQQQLVETRLSASQACGL